MCSQAEGAGSRNERSKLLCIRELVGVGHRVPPLRHARNCFAHRARKYYGALGAQTRQNLYDSSRRFIFIMVGATSVNSFVMRSTTPRNMVVPPDTRLWCKTFLRM